MPRGPKPRYTAHMAAKLSPQERRMIERAACDHDVTIAHVVRQAIKVAVPMIFPPRRSPATPDRDQ